MMLMVPFMLNVGALLYLDYELILQRFINNNSSALADGASTAFVSTTTSRRYATPCIRTDDRVSTFGEVQGRPRLQCDCGWADQHEADWSFQASETVQGRDGGK